MITDVDSQVRPIGAKRPTTQDTAQGSSELGKDAFLKLMMTQMS